MRAWPRSWSASRPSSRCSRRRSCRSSWAIPGQRHHRRRPARRHRLYLPPGRDAEPRGRLDRELPPQPGRVSRRRTLPRLLSPMATMLGDAPRRPGRRSRRCRCARCSTASPRRLDETRETSRYLIGVLVFLGLLGTFYGLLETVQSVSGVLGGLAVGGRRRGGAFADLKARLADAARRHEHRVQRLALRPRRARWCWASSISRRASRRTASTTSSRSGCRATRGSRAAARCRAGDALGAGLYPGAARADRRQPRQSAAHPRPRRGKPHLRQCQLAHPDRAARAR